MANAVAASELQRQESAFCQEAAASEEAEGESPALAGGQGEEAQAEDDDGVDDEGYDEDDVMTTEELLSTLDQALKEVRLYLDGKLKLKSADEFLAELEDEEGAAEQNG